MMPLINGEKAKSFRNYTIIKHDTYNEEYGLTPKIWNLIDNVKDKVNRGKIKIPELEKLTREYPKIPHFANTLASVLLMKGVKRRFFEISQQLFENFSNYVMARCNLASGYTKEEQFEKALELLGEKFDLADLYPARNGGFTEVEIYNYHVTVLQYLIDIEEDNEAQKHLEFLEYYYPDQMSKSPLVYAFISLRMRKMQETIEKERKVEVIPEYISPSDSAPVFTHPEVEIFYKTDYDIDKNIIRYIVKLPRETLVDDMKKMLIDSIARHDYFSGFDWEEETHSFPVHALIILSLLKAEEGLDAFFTILRQSEEFLDFWYGDMLTEDFWQYAYQMGQHRLDRLKDFLLEPNHYSFARVVVSTAVFQLGLHQEQRKKEAAEWMRSSLQYMMDHEEDETLFDTTVFSNVIGDLIELNGKEHLPFIEECYQKRLVSELYEGHLETLKERIAEDYYEDKDFYKYDVCETIDQFYEQWRRYSKMADNPLENKEKEYPDDYDKPYKPFIAAPKVGRNDPCPCGSGKKYKKCCGAGE